LASESAGTQIGVEIRGGCLCLFFRENAAKGAKPEGVPHFQVVQSRKRQRQIVLVQIRPGLRRVRVDGWKARTEDSAPILPAATQNQARSALLFLY
jgi:hypothetical protein